MIDPRAFSKVTLNQLFSGSTTNITLLYIEIWISRLNTLK